MRQRVMLLLLILALSFVIVAPVMAAPGGMPAAHGVDGRVFGGLVSYVAKTNVCWLVEHVTP